MENFVERFEHSLLAVDRLSAHNILEECRKKMTEEETVDQVFMRALESIGEKWEKGETSLSQVYMSGIIGEELAGTFFSFSDSASLLTLPVAIVTFQDYHVLGKRVVLSLFRSRGMSIQDFGHGVQLEALKDRIRKGNIRILLVSTLMLPSALNVRKIKDWIVSEGLDIKLVVGGAPFRFDLELWKQVGADAMGKTAMDALRITQAILQEGMPCKT